MNRIVIVGDYVIDKYSFYGTLKYTDEGVNASELLDEKICQGCAGNIFSNVFSLKQKNTIAKLFSGVDIAIPVIKRYYVDEKLVLREDFVSKNKELTWEEIEKDIAVLDKDDIVIISDYDKNTLTKSLIDKILECSKLQKFRVIVDLKYDIHENYANAFIIKMNSNTLCNHFKIKCVKNISEYVDDLCGQMNSNIIVTRGEDLTLLCEHPKVKSLIKNIMSYHKSLLFNYKDSIGAGDVFTAGLAVRLLDGKNIYDACVFADVASRLSCQSIGTINSVERKNVLKILKEIENDNIRSTDKK